MAVMQT